MTETWKPKDESLKAETILFVFLKKSAKKNPHLNRPSRFCLEKPVIDFIQENAMVWKRESDFTMQKSPRGEAKSSTEEACLCLKGVERK